MWRQSDIYVVSMNGADHESVDEIHDKVRHGGQPWFAVSPLMHAAGMWTAFAALLNGLPVVLYDRTKFDPPAVLADRGARKGRNDDDGRRRVRRAAGRGTATGFLRSVVDVCDRHRRSGDEPEISTRAAGVAAADHADQRIRIVGDRERGLRPQSARRREGHVRAARGSVGAVRGLRPVPAARRAGDRLGRASRPDPARLFRRCRPPPARHFPSSKDSVS